MQKDFNILITGIGGQGLITLLEVLAKTAFNQGLEIRTSELHGLSQRGGSVSVHIRFGQKIYSPMLKRGSANLVLALESQEALAGLLFAGSQTIFLVNQFQTSTLAGDISQEQVKETLQKTSKKVIFIGAAEICKKEFGTDVVAGVYLLGYAIKNGLLPFKIEAIKQAIKETMPEKFWEINLKALEFGCSVR